ncbi:MAG: ABC transporter ATP-binding protein, partial [Sphingomonas hengshuiensis]
PGTSDKFLIEVDGESAFARLQDISFTARRLDLHVFDAAGDAVSCDIQ